MDYYESCIPIGWATLPSDSDSQIAANGVDFQIQTMMKNYRFPRFTFVSLK